MLIAPISNPEPLSFGVTIILSGLERWVDRLEPATSAVTVHVIRLFNDLLNPRGLPKWRKSGKTISLVGRGVGHLSERLSDLVGHNTMVPDKVPQSVRRHAKLLTPELNLMFFANVDTKPIGKTAVGIIVHHPVSSEMF